MCIFVDLLLFVDSLKTNNYIKKKLIIMKKHFYTKQILLKVYN